MVWAAILTIVVWVLAFVSISRDRQQLFDDTAGEVRQLAEFFERHTDRIFQYGDSYLKQIRREYMRNFDLADIESLMSEVPLDRSIASHVTIIDEKGTPILVSGHEIKPGVTARDREYFTFQQNSVVDQLFISQAHRGRNSGVLIVRLVRRFEKPGGGFGGVIFVALEASHITEFFNTMKAGPGSSATLVGEDMNIRARSSYGPLGPGQNISGSRLWQELEQSPVGLYRQISVVDNITRYYAYRRVPAFPLIVAIGVAVDDIHEDSNWLNASVFPIAILATMLILTTSVFLHRQQHLLGKIETKNIQLQAGNLEIQSKNSELENQNAELERFAYTVSHDLKAPLVTIKGFLGLMRQDISARDQEASIRDADQIDKAADKMGQLLDELLELSRVGRQMNAPELINLTQLATEAASQVSIKVKAQGSRLDIDPNMPDIYCDPGRLLEVYQNLIENAFKFMGDQPAPRVEIGAQKEDDLVRCYVRDNGIGVAADYHQRIFDLFDRLDPHVEGTGIGLALVKRIIEVHGGRIWIESAGEGNGSTFWFTIPAGA